MIFYLGKTGVTWVMWTYTMLSKVSSRLKDPKSYFCKNGFPGRGAGTRKQSLEWTPDRPVFEGFEGFWTFLDIHIYQNSEIGFLDMNSPRQGSRDT